jgi:hypothetical protein
MMHRRHHLPSLTLLSRRIGAAMATAAAVTPSAAWAGTGCGQWSAGFTQLVQGLGAFSDFFYGPFFKFGSLGALAIAAVMLLMDDSNMGRIAQLVLRAICVIGFVGVAASFFTTPSANCAPVSG